MIDPLAHLNLAPHCRSAIEEPRRGQLHRSGHGQIGIANQLETFERRLHQRRRTGRGDPSELHLRQADHLRQPAQRKRQHIVAPQRAGRTTAGAALEIVVGKHFIADDGDVSRRAPRREPVQLGLGGDRAGRVVRTDDQERTGAGTGGPLDAGQVDGPRAVAGEVVVAGHEQIHLRQVVEERIARARHEHFIALVAEQLEQQRIRLAGAGRQGDAIRRHRHALSGVLARHRLARGRSSEGARLVRQCAQVGERLDEVGRIGQGGLRRIRERQIEDRPSRRPHRRNGASQAVRRQIGGQAGGEEFGIWNLEFGFRARFASHG